MPTRKRTSTSKKKTRRRKRGAVGQRKSPAKAAADAAVGTLAEIERIQQAQDLKHYVSVLLAQSRGEQPTRPQLRGYRRYWKAVIIPAAISSIPKGLYSRIAGRQHKVLDGQAQTHGLPVEGSTVDLTRVIRWIHDHLAANARKLLAIEGDDPLMAGADSPAMERYRTARAALAELDLLERKGSLLSRDEIHERLSRLATVLRGTGDQLQRECGREALAIWDEGLLVFEREMDRWKGNGKVKRLNVETSK